MYKEKTIVTIMLAGILSGVFVIPAVFGQPVQGKDSPAMVEGAQPTSAPSFPMLSPPRRTRSPYVSAQRNKHAENLYRTIWGIDEVQVRETSGGIALRFSYTVTDSNKAKVLNDEQLTPYLVDEKTGAVLEVPVMPKVGKLRQTANPENGKEYWMVFSNKGNFVKPGSRVDIVIGSFRAMGLNVR